MESVRRAALVGSLLLVAAASLGAQQAVAPPSPPQGPPPTPCLESEIRRQFDFWLGTWDVSPWNVPAAEAPRIGVNVITSIERGCALLEKWTSARGITGRSFNWYDTNLRTWRQLWIAQTGNTLDYSRGEYRDGAMRFLGYTIDAAGARTEQRLTFFNIHRDTVRQLFETSTDSGRTWAPSFDGRYVRRGSP
jgi:hypothetical protein